ncbi:MAG TPA: hypothetical protein VGG10_19755 [Rhizomicrobium sp.]|jgi:hypothetical protein
MRIAVSFLSIATTGLLVASCNPPPLKVPAKSAEQACHCTQGNTTAGTAATTDTGTTSAASGSGTAMAEPHHVARTETHAHHKAQATADTEADESWSDEESDAPEHHTARHGHASYADTGTSYRSSAHDTDYSSNRSYSGHRAPASGGYMSYDEFVRRGDNIGSSGYSGTHRYMPSYSPPSSYDQHSSYNATPSYSDRSTYSDRSSDSSHPYAPPAVSDRNWYSEHSYSSATPPAGNGPSYADNGYSDRSVTDFRFKRKWHDANVSSYSYRSTSRVYQYGDDGYASGGDEGGWRDGYGRWHARTQLTPPEMDARMDPWHGYGVDCPDDQYYGYGR